MVTTRSSRSTRSSSDPMTASWKHCGERLAARAGAASPTYASRPWLSTRGVRLAASDDSRRVRLRHPLQLLEGDRAVDHLLKAVLEQRAGAVAAGAGAQPRGACPGVCPSARAF